MRPHVVLATATYTISELSVAPFSTSAARVWIHGSGAKLVNDTSESLISIYIPTKISDLELDYPNGVAVSVTSSEATLARVVAHAREGLVTTGAVRLVESAFDTTTPSAVLITNSGTLSLDRVSLRGGKQAIVSRAGSSVDATNLLVVDTTDTAIDMRGASGTLNFVTIAKTGTNTTSGTPAGVYCPSNTFTFSLRNSIIWTPPHTPASGDCNFVSSIAGPIAIPGAQSSDPMFNNAFTDLHLKPQSPAVDVVDVGPALDLEGTRRPLGRRLDLGALESH